MVTYKERIPPNGRFSMLGTFFRLSILLSKKKVTMLSVLMQNIMCIFFLFLLSHDYWQLWILLSVSLSRPLLF